MFSARLGGVEQFSTFDTPIVIRQARKEPSFGITDKRGKVVDHGFVFEIDLYGVRLILIKANI